jgi:hypothetical protein
MAAPQCKEQVDEIVAEHEEAIARVRARTATNIAAINERVQREKDKAAQKANTMLQRAVRRRS